MEEPDQGVQDRDGPQIARAEGGHSILGSPGVPFDKEVEPRLHGQDVFPLAFSIFEDT